MTDEAGAWQVKAAARLKSIDGLTANDGRVQVALDANATTRAAAIESALDRAAEATQRQAAKTEEAATILASAIRDLVAASNDNTRTMARLQWMLIGVTVAYVILTGVIALSSWTGRG